MTEQTLIESGDVGKMAVPTDLALANNRSTTNASGHLPSLVRRAADQLASATSAAEILEAREAANFAYDAAKKAARIGKAKKAHDDLIAEAHRAQANALEIEAQAKRRLADEYDAAQERGEVAKAGNPNCSTTEQLPGPSDLGFSRKTIHEARRVRDAEEADPGVVRRTLDGRLERGEEPNKAALREAVLAAAERGLRGSPRQSNRNPLYKRPTEAGAAWTRLYGAAWMLVDWATDENLHLAIKGKKERTDDQSRNIAGVRKAADRLNEIVEIIDAE